MVDSQGGHQGQIQRLVTLDPPKPPSDIVQSALFLPLSSIGPEHKGRKIRTIGQILAFEPKAGTLLLSAVADRAHGPLATLLVDVSTPLLGHNPAVTDAISSEGLLYTRTPAAGVGTRRDELLTLARGHLVTVVGWFEGDGSKLAARVSPGRAYLRPIPIVLEAVHIDNARIPPDNALYRGAIDPFGEAT